MGAMQLFHHDRPVPGDEPRSLVLTFGLDSELNDCISFLIETGAGVFEARGRMGYSYTPAWNAENGSSLTMTFQLRQGVYQENGTIPSFWVLPLTNFLSRYRRGISELAQHPLRLRKVISNPPTGTVREQVTAQLMEDGRNSLIQFSYRGLSAHIEPLLDYEARQESLRLGNSRRIATALMIGDLPSDVSDEEQMLRFLPPDLLLLLGLATGTAVGSPWIETRDSAGQLVIRFHTSIAKPDFSSGHVAINEPIHNGVGQLLTEATMSDLFDTSVLRVTASHTIRGGLRALTVEDSLIHFVRALDGLCHHFGLTPTVSIFEILSHAEADPAQKAIKSAARSVRNLAQCKSNPVSPDVAKIYEEIADRIANTKNLYRGFGVSLEKLLAKFGLADLSVLDAFYQDHPRPDGKGWLDLLSAYRGAAVHVGFISIDDGETAEEVLTLLHHLHDLLLRLIWKMVGYTGTYQPPVIPLLSDSYHSDWVTEDTPPKRLGYL